MSLSEKLFYNFSRLFHCSIIKVLAICFRLESLIFPRKTDCFLCFRFVVSLSRQQILSYQIISCLSTLFLTFLFCFSKSLSRQRVISYQTVRRLSTLFLNFLLFFLKLPFYAFAAVLNSFVESYHNAGRSNSYINIINEGKMKIHVYESLIFPHLSTPLIYFT